MSRRRKVFKRRGPDAEQRRQADLATAVLTAAVCEPPEMERMHEAMRGLFDAGPRAMFAAMAGWAACCWIGEDQLGDGEIVGLAAMDPTTGAPVDPDSIVRSADDWGGVAAMRFIAAKANNDLDTMHAVFASAPSPDAAAALVTQVLTLAARHTRAVLKRDAAPT